jgi:hypothetical protein
MSATNSFETAILQLIFQNANYANLGDATGLRGSSTAGNLYISLHTADPTDAGDQTSSEASYGSYARVAVARDGSSWTVSGANVSNAAAVTFPACTSGSSTVTHFGIGRSSSGAGELYFKGSVGSVAISTGITPSFAAGALDVDVD